MEPSSAASTSWPCAAHLGPGTLARDRGNLHAAHTEYAAALAKAEDGSDVQTKARAALEELPRPERE